MKNRIYIEGADFGRRFNLHILQTNGAGDVVRGAKPVKFGQVMEPEAMMYEPATHIGADACQDLMDQLWRLGFRPERGEMSVGQMQAVNAHLQDMRTLAFAKLEVPKP